MTSVPLKSQSIIPRMDGIAKDVKRLQELASLPFDQFHAEDNVDIAKLRLREALEGVFNIGAHILSRIEGGRATEYAGKSEGLSSPEPVRGVERSETDDGAEATEDKDIARKLGEQGIIEKQFAETALIRMAGYRNPLTHFYAEIMPQELYDIIQRDLGDFDAFLSSVKQVLEHPEKFGLSRE